MNEDDAKYGSGIYTDMDGLTEIEPGMKTRISRMAQREDCLFGKTGTVETTSGTLHLTLNEQQGYPFEVLVTIGKAGTTTRAAAEGIGRMISLMLRNGVLAKDIIRQLEPVGMSAKDKDMGTYSLPAGIAKLMGKLWGDSPAYPMEDARTPLPRPEKLSGFTIKMPIDANRGNMYMTINEHEDEPFEIFASVRKVSEDVTITTEALCRLISLALRSDIHIHQAADQLIGIGGSSPVSHGKQMYQSIPDAIAKQIFLQYPVENEQEENQENSVAAIKTKTMAM